MTRSFFGCKLVMLSSEFRDVGTTRTGFWNGINEDERMSGFDLYAHFR